MGFGEMLKVRADTGPAARRKDAERARSSFRNLSSLKESVFSRNSDRSSDRIGIKQQLANKDENDN